MEKINNILILKGIIIIFIEASYYSWLDDNHIGYVYYVHSHGHGDFGVNIDSISHIDQL